MELKKRSLFIFIFYILFFCSFAWYKNQRYQGVMEFYSQKKLCIQSEKTMYTVRKNYVYSQFIFV